MNTHPEHELVALTIIGHDFSQRKWNYQNWTHIMIFAILGGKITHLKTQKYLLKNSHCEGPRRCSSFSFSRLPTRLLKSVLMMGAYFHANL